MDTVAVYFVASPLQYLAARQIAARFEAGARQVLLWYKPGVGPVVRPDHWDASAYLPWPRWDPLPGPLGRHRRLRDNIRLVADLVGPCDELHLHSAVFDTEAINYFLRALPRACGARTMHARILPDGIISVRRYPLSPAKRVAQHLRRLRRLAAPELDYWPFSGDRIGSDAPFCDRIYVLPGLPHEYPADKVVTLAPLATAAAPDAGAPRLRRGLVIGQPLTGTGLLDTAAMQAVSTEIERWMQAQGIEQVCYKGHPKDPQRELWRPGYEVLELDEPLELWLAHERFDAVAGVRSSALLFAKQLYGEGTTVAAFGWDRVRFKSAAERRAMAAAFQAAGVLLR
ncbi:alpha-2,8-polysialyltransferase family protein [Caldimonas thermodepolymerans]|uniref:alpha-2,8-polysialyltransferase family protein n=1 Tax=Caldimonas thermodepolymerans TaxID=215580 RepID=UPI002235475A|nr:alpha-2,8-polysialyltransferase family protein [Caldimonas thermodepolymerans]UZG45398.1 alpha-2,8-polysialyltransferase family protein [Caldimonas thermodepolymerans]